MIYLLMQISASLALAAILGWFIGWSWRGFRDQDRIEDARRALRTTEEIKSRELSEAYRQADTARAEIDTLRRRLGSPDRQSRQRAPQTASASSRNPRQRPEAIVSATESARAGAPLRRLAPVANLEVAKAARPGPTPPAAETAAADRQAEAEAALREKTAAVLSLQAQLRALRARTDDRAEEMARLEARLIELEPLEQQLAERNRQVEQLERGRGSILGEREEESRRAEGLTKEIDALRAKIAARDQRINELRSEHNDSVAALEATETARQGAVERPASPDPTLERLQRELADARQQLQRQIERNRKQDAVHRSVVQEMQQRLSEQRDNGEREALQEQVAELQQQLTGIQERERRIDALQEQLRDVERTRDEEIERYRDRLDRLQHPAPPAAEDDLQQIPGIGPKLSMRLRELGIWSFAQIAQWSPEDVTRISRQIGAFPGRIQHDGWVQAARRLLRAP